MSIEQWAVMAALPLAIAGAACGKKGPPLAPIVHIPAAVDQIDARRRGDEVALTLTVPSKNIDGSIPVDIGRIEVYGYTGTSAPPRGRFLELGTLVGTVTVRQPKPDTNEPPPDPASEPGEPIAGGTATIVESLTPEALVAKPIPQAPAAPGRQLPTLPPVPGAVVETGPLRRFYLALPFSPRGRPGPPGTVAELHLTELPEPPDAVTATYIADVVQLTWEPSGGLIGFLLDRALPPELSPLDTPLPVSSSSASSPPDGPTRYNVYREIAADPDAAPPNPAPAPNAAPPPSAPAPVPSAPVLINPAPLEVLTLSDPLTGLDGRERCYVIRSVRGVAAQAVEGNPSRRTCVTPLDDVPPEPPAGLTTVTGDGTITLVWQPNAEPDVAGYLVLRGEAGDATLTPLTDTVVTDTRFTDRTVRPGVRYLYAVQAIDTRLPRPNVSVESARVEETAR